MLAALTSVGLRPHVTGWGQTGELEWDSHNSWNRLLLEQGGWTTHWGRAESDSWGWKQALPSTRSVVSSEPLSLHRLSLSTWTREHVLCFYSELVSQVMTQEGTEEKLRKAEFSGHPGPGDRRHWHPHKATWGGSKRPKVDVVGTGRARPLLWFLWERQGSARNVI